ncbi:MAG: class I SAM-dependent methyltransferase [Steroidobacteraceae bacterium]
MSSVPSGNVPRMSAARLAGVAATLFANDAMTQRFRPYICPFEELLPIVPAGSSVLDVGCGGGLFLGLLAVEGGIRSGVGFDSSPSAIAVAQRMRRRAVEHGARATLDFQHRDAAAPWPEGTFDVVSVIDVMHHVPRRGQRSLFELAAARVGPSGLMIYKDIAGAPVWRAWANRLHDLLVARQWIDYVPIDQVERWGADLGLALVDARAFNRYWYRHELRVFKRVQV